jgi:hypothetical protein
MSRFGTDLKGNGSVLNAMKLQSVPEFAKYIFQIFRVAPSFMQNFRDSVL